MAGAITLLMVLVMLTIPIVIVAKIVRRVREVSQRLQDPIRLQRAFAESAAAALRRAGADPKAVAKVERLGQGFPDDRAAQVRAEAYEARIGLQRKGGWAAPIRRATPAVPIPPPASAAPEPPSLFEEELRLVSPRPAPPHMAPIAAPTRALHRPPRPRRQTPVAPLGGFEMGDAFRLSEPPETGEPRGPLAFNANWLALAALVGAAAYYLMR